MGALPDDLPDLVQEVFAAVGPGLKTYQKDRPGATFRGWLRGIVRHKLNDHFRRDTGRAEGARRRSCGSRRSPTDRRRIMERTTPRSPVSIDAPSTQVRAQFEVKTWEAFWRVAMEERSPAEVADELGISPNGVRQAKSRVLRRLKEELGELIA